MRAAASLAARALLENRAVGLTRLGPPHSAVMPADRGARQHQKIMSLLAAVGADGTTPLVEALVQGLPRLRRGMTAVVITPSLERDWVRPLAALRGRGIRAAVCLLDRGRLRRVRAGERRARRRARPRSSRTSGAPSARCATPWPSTTSWPTASCPERPLGETLVTTTPGRPGAWSDDRLERDPGRQLRGSGAGCVARPEGGCRCSSWHRMMRRGRGLRSTLRTGPGSWPAAAARPASCRCSCCWPALWGFVSAKTRLAGPRR